MNELGARMRVIAIGRGGNGDDLEYPPRRDTRLLAGDDAYLAGPYDELQRVLRREREGPSADRAGRRRPAPVRPSAPSTLPAHCARSSAG
jgi:hypothetical protein